MPPVTTPVPYKQEPDARNGADHARAIQSECQYRSSQSGRCETEKEFACGVDHSERCAARAFRCIADMPIASAISPFDKPYRQPRVLALLAGCDEWRQLPRSSPSEIRPIPEQR